jgi:hypothetical protein
MNDRRIRILSPSAGASLQVNTAFNLVLSIFTKAWPYPTAPIQFTIVLMDSTGADVFSLAPPPPADYHNFTVPIPAVAGWPNGRANTILVYVDRQAEFCRITVNQAGAASPVVINSPAAGSGVSYPFSAFGTADSTCTSLSGDIIVPGTGQDFSGTVITGAPYWQIRFDSGPSTHATLKVKDNTNNYTASESINGSTGGGGTG